jgi:hypothetical protein
MNTVLTVVLALLLTVFLAGVAIAEDHSYMLGGEGIYGPSISPGNSEGLLGQSSFSGWVESVDLSQGTLTVAPIPTDVTSPSILKGKVTLSTDETTSIKMCNDSVSLSDVNVGEKVDVMYHVKDGEFVAEGIDIAKNC